MNARQEAKYNMQRAVEQHCDNNLSIVGKVVAFQTAYNGLKALNAQIGGTEQLTDSPLKGISIDKGNSKQALAQLASDIAGFIYAFASVTGNETLKQEANFSYTKLLATRDDEFPPRCQNIHDRASENMPAIEDYGVSAAKLADLQTAIDNYALETPKPRVARSIRKTHNANLTELFKQSDAVLRDQMDNLVQALRVQYPDFVKTYESARIIIDPAKTQTQLKGVVTGANSGLPVNAATVIATDASTPPAGFTKQAKTNAQGKYTIKPLPPATYNITVTAPGFEDFAVNGIEIKLGEIEHLDAAMDLD